MTDAMSASTEYSFLFPLRNPASFSDAAIVTVSASGPSGEKLVY